MPLKLRQPHAMSTPILSRTRAREADGSRGRLGLAQVRRSLFGTGITVALVLLVLVVPAHMD